MSALPLYITLIRGQTGDKANPRFVVTSLAARDWPARAPYEELYCAWK